jgi:neutral ceramidase
MNWETLEPDDIVAELGPIDPELLVMVFSNEEGSPLGALVHFTLHPAILVGHDWLVSADYIAETSATLSASLGGAPVLFLNGALGNINHINYRDAGRAIGFSESSRVGILLGHAAVDAITEGATDLDLQLVGSNSFAVTLAQRTIDREDLEHAQSVLAAHDGRPVEALDGIPPEAYALWATGPGRHLPPTLEVTISVIHLDRVVLVYVPFEVFVEFGLEIRRAFPDHIVRVVSLGWGHYGYLPTAKAFAEGGYEPTMGTSTVQCGQGEYLFHEITTHLRRLLDNGREK